MTLSEISALLPSRRTVLTVVLSSVLGGAVAIDVAIRLKEPAGPPAAPSDPQFVKLGRTYLPSLGKSYGAAWEAGAKSLDAGQPLSTAIAAVGKSWDVSRSQLFDQMVTPELAKLVPESQKDSDMTPQQRAAMAAAWRGFAAGLGK